MEGHWVWNTQSSNGNWGPRTDVEVREANGVDHKFEFRSLPYSHSTNRHRATVVLPAAAVDAIGCLLKVPILAKGGSVGIRGPPEQPGRSWLAKVAVPGLGLT